jgi:hypothetical protein
MRLWWSADLQDQAVFVSRAVTLVLVVVEGGQAQGLELAVQALDRAAVPRAAARRQRGAALIIGGPAVLPGGAV